MEHTKGKWQIDGGSNKKNDLFIWPASEEEGGHAIATVHGDIQEGAEANARLIAAAPDLLAACRRIKERCDTGGLINKDTTGLYNCVKFAILAAEA